MDHLFARPLAALVIGIVLELALGRFLSRTAKGWLAALAGLVAFAGALLQLPVVAAGHAIDGTFFIWDRGIPLSYHIDGLSLLFVLMGTGIGTAILLYCVRYMEHEPEGTTRFYALMLLFIAGFVNLVCSANLLMVYLSWEIIGLCSYFLVGFWYKQAAAADGSRKVLILTHLAGYGLLAGILLLYSNAHTWVWTDPMVANSFTTGIFILMLVAAMAKSVMFPLHTWIPEAMNAPTPVSALLHSACYVKAGIYLIARMYSFSGWAPEWNTLVLVIGCVTMFVGAVFALVQVDLKRLLAFSTISQLGHIVVGLGLGTNLGIAAGLLYCFSHGLFKGTLFLCSGAVQHATGTRDLRELGGLASRMPATARIWLIAAASIVGVPLTNGFVAKWLLLDAGLDANQMVVVLITWLVSVFTAFYMLKATVGIFYGDMPDYLRRKTIHDASPSMQVGMGLLAVLCILFGIAPQIVMEWVITPAVTALQFQWDITTSWFGISTSSAGMQVTAGAAIALIAVIVGAAAYRITRAPRAAPVRVFTGGDPLPVADDYVTAADFAELAESAFQPIYRLTNPDPFYLAVWRRISDSSAAIGKVTTPVEEKRGLTLALAFAVVLAVLVWFL